MGGRDDKNRHNNHLTEPGVTELEMSTEYDKSRSALCVRICWHSGVVSNVWRRTLHFNGYENKKMVEMFINWTEQCGGHPRPYCPEGRRKCVTGLPHIVCDAHRQIKKKNPHVWMVELTYERIHRCTRVAVCDDKLAGWSGPTHKKTKKNNHHCHSVLFVNNTRAFLILHREGPQTKTKQEPL